MPGDSIYKRRDWKKAVRYWQARLSTGLACARCGGPIQRGGERGPASLDVGHIIGKHEARQMGWTEAQINAVSNTQPEHQLCSRRHGARYGNAVRGRALPEPVTSQAW